MSCVQALGADSHGPIHTTHLFCDRMDAGVSLATEEAAPNNKETMRVVTDGKVDINITVLPEGVTNQLPPRQCVKWCQGIGHILLFT